MAMSTEKVTVNEREHEKKGETEMAENKVIEAKVDETGKATEKPSVVDKAKEIGGKIVTGVKKNWKPFTVGAVAALSAGAVILFKMANGVDTDDDDEYIDTDDYEVVDPVADTSVDSEI